MSEYKQLADFMEALHKTESVSLEDKVALLQRGYEIGNREYELAVGADDLSLIVSPAKPPAKPPNPNKPPAPPGQAKKGRVQALSFFGETKKRKKKCRDKYGNIIPCKKT